jgi:ubiquinol-cytochrome c reductase iron-sulfur subunit
LSSKNSVNEQRRMLVVATGAVGAVGALAAISPLFVSMAPSERAKAAGAPVEVDLAKLEPGMLITEAWRGKPVWILHRTDEMLSKLGETAELVSDPDSKLPMQPDYAKNVERSIKPQYLVLVGICTHLGCSPTQKLEAGEASGLGADWSGGFFCPCHGSKFDLAGRVYKGVPAPANLEVPPHQFLSDSRLLIGDDAARS